MRAAVAGESRESFIANMARGLQKADETEYWPALIHFAGLINEKEFASIDADRKEIAKVLTRIVKTSKENA